MRNFHATLTLAVAMAGLMRCGYTGCAPKKPGPRPTGEPGRYGQEIEVAAQLTWSDHKAESFQMIAMKPDLSEHDQLYLINAILHDGDSDDQAYTLALLVANPCLTDKARHYIVQNLHRIHFSSDRKVVVQALINYPAGSYKRALLPAGPQGP